jgi:hypothetical protein
MRIGQHMPGGLSRLIEQALLPKNVRYYHLG